ncbi:hypothetical protein [Pontibacter akesuensis]|nr:hypothetical protein [Pontibacter akesuensis]
MVIRETPCVKVTFFEEHKTLLISWLRGPSTKELHATYLHALQFIEAHPDVVLFCTDQTLIGSLTREQETWLMQEYYPKVYHILQDDVYAAVVFSESHFNAIVMNYQANAIAPGQHFIQFNYFTVLSEAMHWLKGINKGQSAELL